jgi:hypothetical protein
VPKWELIRHLRPYNSLAVVRYDQVLNQVNRVMAKEVPSHEDKENDSLNTIRDSL